MPETDLTELRRRADKINSLLKEFSTAAIQATKTLGKLNGTSQELDQELSKFITYLEGFGDTEEGVSSLRELKARNGLNLRIASGMNGSLSRLKDTKANSVIVS